MTNATISLKKILKGLLIALLVVLVTVSGYAVYFVASFTRIQDNQTLSRTASTDKNFVLTNTTYNLLSWNVGFGAYSDDYSFFMDGGKYSRAFSKEAVETNITEINSTVTLFEKDTLKSKFDFILYQEVDFDSTRSYKVDIRQILTNNRIGYSATFAQNYNSPYILYPFNSPHGANKSGLLTLSRFQITSAIRKQLPIENGFMKFFDLDRCYSKNKISVNNNQELVIYNLHLSAYTSDGTIAIEQLKILLDDCKREVAKGNYIICAGDFNKDLIDTEGGSATLFGQDTEAEGWAKQIDPQIFEGTGMTKIAPCVNSDPVPTCRNANAPYSEGNKVYIIDGFLVSSNVSVIKAATIDKQFKNSDHNPVYLTFKLLSNI